MWGWLTACCGALVDIDEEVSVCPKHASQSPSWGLRGRPFDVVLDMAPGKMLGLQISKDSLRNVLLVRQLLPVGAVCDWNKEHPSDKIEIGCIIVAVDGVAGDASLMSDACVQSSKSIEAKVIRMKIIKDQ
uniref:PDZ domain-containing protein n=1 Tax=Noctiluca scintillans TaxID=2966 RepID=A0A7S1F9S5_NOCSC|mmetsp:Transcript_46238/g.122626  ORF Transcript_46238/g.122626 Transcript_46238/m.122626 type:complete len:131 (+) Transcript_46238:69-461(+)